MSVRLRQLALLLVCCWVTPAHAVLLFYEGFQPRDPDTCPPELCHGYNYAEAERLAYAPDPDANNVPNGQYNVEYDLYWRRATAAAPTTVFVPGIGSGSLSVTGLPPSVGNMAQWVMEPSTAHLARTPAFEPALTDGNSWFWSGLLRIDNVAAWNNTNTADGGGVVIAGFSNGSGSADTTPSTFQGNLHVARNSADSNQYFIASGTTNNGVRFDTNTPLNDGDNVFVVVAYDKIAGTNADRARLWINPPASTFADDSLMPTPNVDVGFIGGVQRTPASFMLRSTSQGTAGNRPLVSFDELRIATTWTEVTGGASPPPGLMGDFNGDGTVDAADYVIWRKTMDGNSAKYDEWRNNFGSTAMGAGGSSLATVPEPASIALALLTSTLAGICRRSYRRLEY